MSHSEAVRDAARRIEKLRADLMRVRKAHKLGYAKFGKPAALSSTVIKGFEQQIHMPRLDNLEDIAGQVDFWLAKLDAWRKNPDDPEYRIAKAEGRVDFKRGAGEAVRIGR